MDVASMLRVYHWLWASSSVHIHVCNIKVNSTWAVHRTGLGAPGGCRCKQIVQHDTHTSEHCKLQCKLMPVLLNKNYSEPVDAITESILSSQQQQQQQQQQEPQLQLQRYLAALQQAAASLAGCWLNVQVVFDACYALDALPALFSCLTLCVRADRWCLMRATRLRPHQL
eukprot:scaffold115423_cov20-Tisochrysis_lutea.AAC.1